jgi:translation initiation factor IF-3
MKKTKKSKVLNLTRQQHLDEVLKGRPMTGDELAAQTRRNMQQAAQDVGLSKKDAKLATMDFPPVLDPEKSN